MSAPAPTGMSRLESMLCDLNAGWWVRVESYDHVRLWAVFLTSRRNGRQTHYTGENLERVVEAAHAGEPAGFVS